MNLDAISKKQEENVPSQRFLLKENLYTLARTHSYFSCSRTLAAALGARCSRPPHRQPPGDPLLRASWQMLPSETAYNGVSTNGTVCFLVTLGFSF